MHVSTSICYIPVFFEQNMAGLKTINNLIGVKLLWDMHDIEKYPHKRTILITFATVYMEIRSCLG